MNFPSIHRFYQLLRIGPKKLFHTLQKMSTIGPNKTSPEFNLQELCEEFKKFEGGQITCKTNDESGIALICIDHVEKRNGLSGKMMADLHQIVRQLENWTIGKGLILYGQGVNFCSGGYLETVKNILNPKDGYKMSYFMQDSMSRLRNLPLVSVSLVNGMAIGGGAEILLATDYRLLTQSAEISFVEAKMGVGTGWAGGYFLRELVGHQKALDILLTSRKILPNEAIDLGLCDHILPPLPLPESDNNDVEKYLETAVEWLNVKIGYLPANVSRTVKSIVNSRSLEEERKLFATIWGGIDHQNALNKNLKHK